MSMRIRLIPFVIALGLASAHAVTPGEQLPDSGQEARARRLSAELRCLVCQNQSIDDSDAALAADLRRLVRERIVAGDTDRQIRDYLVARYGEFVLLDPPFSVRTLVLWLLPGLALLAGAGMALSLFRRRGRDIPAPPPAGLTDEEEQALDALLKRDHGP